MTTALITGANGFLGTHLTKKALARGWQVRALCLEGTPVSHLENTGAEIVFGDVLKPETLTDSMQGVDYVFHVAGTTVEWHRTPEFCYRLNTLGTRNVCRAAMEAGVGRLVHTATAATIGSTPVGTLSTEETLWDHWDTGIYSRSKFLGEAEALRAGAQGLDVVICCPHQILGDGDFGPSAPGKIVVLFAQGKIPLYVNVKSQFLDVEDCAEGHLLAAEKGRRGEKYILAGPEAVDMKTFFNALSELIGKSSPKYTAPFWLVKILAHLLEWMADHITHRSPLLTVGNANMIQKDLTCSIEKARNDLGFAPGSWQKALEKAASWFQDNGYFEKPLP